MRLARDENSISYVCLDGSDLEIIRNKYGLSLSECKLYKIVKYSTSGEVYIQSGAKLYNIGYL